MELERQVSRLKNSLKRKNQQAQKDEAMRTAMRTSLKRIFTSTQSDQLEHPNKKARWKAEDISSAMSLYSAGARSYRLLRKRNFPLPAPSTLRRWAKQIEIKPGILNKIIQLMSKWDYDQNERLCVLSFDEVKIKSTYEYDKANDIAMCPKKYAQVVMVRGLVKNWKQVVYYDLDAPMTATILKFIISKLEEICFTVIAVVSDMGPTNVSLWRELSISENQPFIFHPCNPMKKIFFFADIPHMIKLLRNHFIDTGFVLNGKIINVEPVKKLLGLEKDDLKICFKISNKHLEVRRSDRQKVKFATQLFSHSVSASIRRCITLGKSFPPNSLECADFLKATNDWFDIFNSKCPSIDSRPRMRAFGLALDDQRVIINTMTENIRNMRTPTRRSLLPFQKGILLSNASLPLLLDYVSFNHSLKYIITNRLNQDDLELFFGVIRSKGGLHDHPTPLEFKYRLRSCILGKHFIFNKTYMFVLSLVISWWKFY